MTTTSPTVFAASWCSFCQRLIRGLRAAEIGHTVIDVDLHPEHDEWIRSVNNGNRLVPTVRFADGSHLSNPTPDQVRAHQASLS